MVVALAIGESIGFRNPIRLFGATERTQRERMRLETSKAAIEDIYIIVMPWLDLLPARKELRNIHSQHVVFWIIADHRSRSCNASHDPRNSRPFHDSPNPEQSIKDPDRNARVEEIRKLALEDPNVEPQCEEDNEREPNMKSQENFIAALSEVVDRGAKDETH